MHDPETPSSNSPSPIRNPQSAIRNSPPLSRRRRKEIGSLTRKKYREQLGQMLVEGVRSVEAAVEAGAPLVELLVAGGAEADDRIARLAAAAGVPVHVVPEDDLARLSDVQTSQGVLAVARIVRLPEEELAGCRAVLALDGVQDPGNAGTLLRTAAWFGADAVVAGPGTVDLFNPKVVRAAMGGLWDLRLAGTTDLGALLARLKEHGFACYGADLQGRPARTWAPGAPSVLVLGSEAHGMTASVQAALDERIAIPAAAGRRGAESLNVGVAAGILLYEWLGERR